MNKNAFLRIFFLSLLIFIITIPFAGSWAGIDYSTLIGFAGYFYLSMYCLARYEVKLSAFLILLALLLGRSLICIDIIIFYFYGDIWSLPEFLFHLLGIVCGYLYWRLKNPFNIIVAFIGCLLAVFMFFAGWNYWLHKVNYGTFAGKINEYKLQTNFEAFDENGKLLTNKDFENKIVILDFWHTACGVCFEKFPYLQSFYERHENNTNLLILAVNKPIDEDNKHSAFEIIKKKGYSFPVVISKDSNLPEKFGVTGYPTTIIIDKEGKVIFKGSVENAIFQIESMKLK